MSELDTFCATFDAEPGYLDWASFGPLSSGVRTEAKADAELLGTGRRSSVELIASRAQDARTLLAELLGVPAGEITLQPSTTYGLMHALYGITGKVLISRDEFPSLTLTAARAAEARGALAPQWISPPEGFMSVDAVADALTDETTAVAVSLVDFRTGYTVDLAGLREVIGDRLLLVDAIQGFGVADADFAAADVVAGNGYKWLRAGRGTGWARFSPRARERIAPVLSGFAGAGGSVFSHDLPEASATAQAFTVTGDDYLAAGRLATALAEVKAAGVKTIAAAVADRADEIVFYADRYDVPVRTPHDRAHRAGIIALEPAAADAGALSAALANRGVAFTARSGLVRLSAHAATDEDTMRLLAEGLAEFASVRRG